MVRMGVIEAADVLAALAAFALNADEFPGIVLVAVMWRVFARVAAACNPRDGLRAVVVEVAEQHAAALVGIRFLSVLTKGEGVRLGELEHGPRSEVRGQIAEVKTQRLCRRKGRGFHLCNLTSDLCNYSSFQNLSLRYFSPESQRIVTMVAR